MAMLKCLCLILKYSGSPSFDFMTISLSSLIFHVISLSGFALTKYIKKVIIVVMKHKIEFISIKTYQNLT